MDATISSDEGQQIVPMPILTPEEKAPTVEIKSSSLLLRLSSLPTHVLQSFRLPRFSDRSLRIVFLSFIALIGITSFTIALIIGFAVLQFKDQCLLYASFDFQTFMTQESNWTLRIIPLSEHFSPQSTCDFCTFYNVFTFIYCIMTAFFFILFNGDHQIMTTNDRCLIIPWFPISVILGFFSLINASVMTNGFLKFCSTMTSRDPRITSCTQLNQIFFEQYPQVSSLFTSMLFAIIGSWCQLAFFIAIIAVLTIRLSTSFEWTTSGRQPTSNTNDCIMMQSMEQRERLKTSIL